MSQAKILILTGFTLLLMTGYQNCSKYKFASVDEKSDAGNLTSSVDDSEVLSPSPGSGDEGATPAPPAPQPESDPKTWLAANCDETVLRQAPMALSFAATGGNSDISGIMQNSVTISDKQIAIAQQIAASAFTVEKTEYLEVQQVQAEKINIEALEIGKIQQLQADEIRVRANLVSDTFQQITAYGGNGPKLHLQAGRTNEVQQVSALCLRTNYSNKIQIIPFAKIIGDSATAEIGEIQQVQELQIIDASVGYIQQVQVLTLKNSKVRKVHQVQKLILINSTVDEISGVIEVINQ